MRKLAISLIAPLVLGLAACGSGNGGEGDVSGEPVAAVAAPEGKQWYDVVSVTDEGGYLVGNPDAPIKLTEYASYTCPGCGAFAQQSSEELRDDYINSGRVSLEFRNFIRDPIDLAAARAIRCAPKESFLVLSDQFFAQQMEFLNRAQQLDPATNQRIGTLPAMQRPLAYAEATGMDEFFAQRGVSRDQLKSCLSDEKELQALADMVQGYAKKYDIPGTPTFFINGKQLQVTGWAPVKEALQNAGARK